MVAWASESHSQSGRPPCSPKSQTGVPQETAGPVEDEGFHEEGVDADWRILDVPAYGIGARNHTEAQSGHIGRPTGA